jgi:hypothetical protein
MITAEKLTQLTSMPPALLTLAIRGSGYIEDEFTGAKFLGITNGGQFCYWVTYKCEGGTDSTKVYLTYNHKEGTVSAEY